VIRRIVPSLVTIAAVTAIACVDMSAPKGAASISQLLLPSPSVVVGDTMRDSTGAVASLKVTAYDGNNTPIENASSQFFVLDTTKLAHIANSSLLIGDKQGSIRVVGQVSGIQTTVAPVSVTVAPTTFALSTTPALPDTFVVPFTGGGDTTSSSTGTQAIAVTLKGVGDTASLGFIVKYQLVYAPATVQSSTVPAVFIGADASKVSLVDTTDATGASRSVIVKSALLADAAVQGGTKSDSVVVLVTTTYKGKPVNGSPIRVKLPLKGKLVLP
jgi:hypothetical protein